MGKTSVARSVKSLEAKGVVVRSRRQSPEKGDEPTTYSLNLRAVSQNGTGGCPKIEHPPVPKRDTQQTVIQETVDNSIVVVMAQLQKFGLSDNVSAAFTEKYPATYLTSKLQQAQALVDQDSPLVDKNPAGWLRKAIEENYAPTESSSTRKQKKVAAAAEVDKQIADKVRERHREQSAPEPIGADGLTTETA